MNPCAHGCAANDDACPASGIGTRPLAGLAAVATRLDRHRARALPCQNVGHNGRRLSFVIPGSWRPLLRQSEVLSPVTNVFPPNVFPVLESHHKHVFGAPAGRIPIGLAHDLCDSGCSSRRGTGLVALSVQARNFCPSLERKNSSLRNWGGIRPREMATEEAR